MYAGPTTADASNAPPGARWIGKNITGLQAGVFLLMGLVATSGVHLAPLTLGALVTAGRLTASQLGIAASAELLMFGVTSLAFALLVHPTRIRLWAGGAAAALMLIQIGTVSMVGTGVILTRGAAGIADGILVWFPMSMIARSLKPGRWAALYVVAMNLVPAILAAALSTPLMSSFGAGGGYLLLSGLAALGCLCSQLLPNRLTPLPAKADSCDSFRSQSIAGSARIATMLLRTFVVMGGYGAVWAYLSPLSAQAGNPAATIGYAVSAALSVQMLGGLIAAFAADRMPLFLILAVGTVTIIAVSAMLVTLPSAGMFIGCVMSFAFLSAVLYPFEMRLAIASDPTRRSAVLLSGVQSLGGASGPVVAAAALAPPDMRGAILVAIGLFSLTLILTGILWVWVRSGGSSQASILAPPRVKAPAPTRPGQI